MQRAFRLVQKSKLLTPAGSVVRCAGGCGRAGLTEFEPNSGNVGYKSSAVLSVSVSDPAQDLLNVSHVNEPSELHCAYT